MSEFILNFGNLIQEDFGLWICALVGSGLFLIQLALNFFGAGDHDLEAPSTDVGTGDFKWLSKQAVIGFIMMFGWTALTARKEFGLSGYVSVLFGLGGGLIAVVLTGILFKAVRKFHSPGSIFNTEDAVGKEAVVYHKIPKGGMGRITVNLNDITHEINAISDDANEVNSFSRVQVIRRMDENTVVVVQIK